MSDPTLPPTSPLSYQSTGTLTESDPGQRSQAMVAHLLGILGILGTGIFYLIKRNDPKTGPFLRDQMKEVFNFELLLAVAIFAWQILIGILVAVTKLGVIGLLGFLVLMAMVVGNWILVITSAMKANKGVAARYPFKIAAIK